MVSLLEILGALFLFAGWSLTLIAAIGIFRQGNLLDRQHIATKPQVLSLILNLTGAALLVRDSTMTWTMVLVIAFQLITSPISAHMLARAGYRTGTARLENLVVDELREDLHVHSVAVDNEKDKR